MICENPVIRSGEECSCRIADWSRDGCAGKTRYCVGLTIDSQYKSASQDAKRCGNDLPSEWC